MPDVTFSLGIAHIVYFKCVFIHRKYLEVLHEQIVWTQKKKWKKKKNNSLYLDEEMVPKGVDGSEHSLFAIQ